MYHPYSEELVLIVMLASFSFFFASAQLPPPVFLTTIRQITQAENMTVESVKPIGPVGAKSSHHRHAHHRSHNETNHRQWAAQSPIFNQVGWQNRPSAQEPSSSNGDAVLWATVYEIVPNAYIDTNMRSIEYENVGSDNRDSLDSIEGFAGGGFGFGERLSKCQEERTVALESRKLGVANTFLPMCEMDGLYARKQSVGSFDICSNSVGEIIQETAVPSGTVLNCDWIDNDGFPKLQKTMSHSESKTGNGDGGLYIGSGSGTGGFNERNSHSYTPYQVKTTLTAFITPTLAPTPMPTIPTGRTITTTPYMDPTVLARKRSDFHFFQAPLVAIAPNDAPNEAINDATQPVSTSYIMKRGLRRRQAKNNTAVTY